MTTPHWPETQHNGRCDYAQRPIPYDPECYCPAPGEEPLPCGHLREEEHMFNCRDYHEDD